MTPQGKYITECVYPVVARLLPKYSSPNAWAHMTAIGLQESAFTYRRQQPKGPARGWWQFEEIGVRGVLQHLKTASDAAAICLLLGYDPTDSEAIHLAIEDNDVLAACFARLNLRTDSRPLPDKDHSTDGWLIYLSVWRPGKPRPGKWPKYFEEAWQIDWPGTVRV